MDLILHIESDGDLIEARNEFINLKNSTTRSGHWGTHAEKDRPEAKTIRTVLNIHELVAVSINEGVIDERVFRCWFNKAFIDDYKSMSGYIDAVREYKKNPKIFKEFETIASRWDDDRTWYDSPGFWARKRKAFTKFIRA